MNEKDMDKKIKEALIHYTNEGVKDKEILKNRIEQEIFEKGRVRLNKKRFSLITILTSVAALVIVFLFLNTEAGYATIDKIKTLFEPQKEITQSIEGNDEKTNVTLHEHTKSEYVIYVDEERYKVVEDKIVTKEPLDDVYPEVSMEIIQEIEKSQEEIIETIANGLESKEYVIAHSMETDYPKPGYLIYAVENENREWNTPVEKYFIMQADNHEFFIFKQRFFVEAEEGHGARFDEMIKDFYIIPRSN